MVDIVDRGTGGSKTAKVLEARLELLHLPATDALMMVEASRSRLDLTDGGSRSVR